MTGLWKSIFGKDDVQAHVRERSIESTEAVKKAANRLEETIRDVLLRNDNITGRKQHVPDQRS